MNKKLVIGILASVTICACFIFSLINLMSYYQLLKRGFVIKARITAVEPGYNSAPSKYTVVYKKEGKEITETITSFVKKNEWKVNGPAEVTYDWDNKKNMLVEKSIDTLLVNGIIALLAALGLIGAYSWIVDRVRM